MIKVLLVVSCLLLLSGCAGPRIDAQPVVIKRQYETVPMFHPPSPEPVKMGQFRWKVLTPDIAEAWVEDAKKGDTPGQVWYAISPKNYEVLSNNIAELKRYIKQQQAIIDYYRKNAKGMSSETSDIPGMAKPEPDTQ